MIPYTNRENGRSTSIAAAAGDMLLLLAIACLLLVPVRPAESQAPVPEDPSLVGDSKSVCQAFWDQEYDEALKLADKILKTEESIPVKVGVYKCTACTYVAKGELPNAMKSIESMLQLDPSARYSPDYLYPPPVLDLYHTVRESLYAGSMDIKTIAIGDFEDNSVFVDKDGKYDYSKLRLALVHTVMADLAQATSLKIVDRQRTETILKEIELGQSGFTDPEEAVRAGKLLGAQTFIFGQYMILNKNTVRIDARVVHTATGEVILTHSTTGDFSGDPEKFLALERDLVMGLAEGIEKILLLGEAPMECRSLAASYFDGKTKTIGKRKKYVESKFLTAEALELEDRGDLKQARTVWHSVVELDPENDVARARVRSLDALL
ncbi:MAG: CsgG/HfaB family protein [Candidatus Eisenbacteria bacterium]|nr:CsgG/HfaB family protein [Candidatus Eisenbacteria bacterium]